MRSWIRCQVPVSSRRFDSAQLASRALVTRYALLAPVDVYEGGTDDNDCENIPRTNAFDAVERHVVVNTEALDDLTFEQSPNEEYASANAELGQGGE